MKDTVDVDALAVECPNCGMPPRHLCCANLGLGNSMEKPHVARVRDALLAERDSACSERDAALREVEKMRQALCEARYPLAIAASYQDDPSITLGLRIHARQSAAAVTAIDTALSQDKERP